MNETEMLALGEALARAAVLRPGEQIPFRDYVRRVLDGGEGQIVALFGAGTFVVSVDGRPVDGRDSAVPVTAGSPGRALPPAGAHAGRAEPGCGPPDLLELTPSHYVGA